jgi:hypothetical protein
MKKILIFAVVFTAVFVGGLLLTSFSSHESTLTMANRPIPEDIIKIFDNSCIQCHSDKGSSIAKSRLNINKWDTYDSVKQDKKISDICKTVTRGSMPPRSFLRKKPQATLSETQKVQICSWK